MNDNPNPVFPCRCGHSITAHDTLEVDQGGYEDLDDGEGGYAWRPDWKQCFVCLPCDLECNYEQMNNLEYLEYKSNDYNKCS